MVLDDLLLDAKLVIPQPRPGAVSRGELIESARTSDCRVVGVTAPAGYGKSTLLLEWARAEDRRVAWVSLDRFDDDPAVLVTLLASAYARISPGDADLMAGMGGHGVSVLGRAAPRLASVLRASPVPFVIMLDDLHELQSPACHDVLSVVISGIPPGSQLVAASRSEQPHLPRLRASGDALEFVASDLALDASGAERIFTEAHVRLSPEAGRRGGRTDRGLAGRHLPCGRHRERQRRRRVGDLRRRPLRGRLPLPRVVGAPSREQPALPAVHGGARPAVCAPLRRGPRRARGARAAARPRGLQHRSSSRWTAGGSGTATTPCSASSSSASSVGSSPSSSRSCTCARPTGTRPTGPRRWRWSTC